MKSNVVNAYKAVISTCDMCIVSCDEFSSVRDLHVWKLLKFGEW
jgi:hypothetical protein